MTKDDKLIYGKLHLSILLAGMTGVFGKIITLNEGLLVWYRVMLTSIFLFVFLFLSKKLERISLRDFRRIAFVGILLSTHWVLFYASIKLSNVSVGVVCFSTIGFFTAVLEPLILRRRFSVRELFFSLITLAGVLLIFSFDMQYRLGIGLGIVSAAFASLFTIATKRVTNDYRPRTILFYEMVAGWIYLSLLLPIYLYLFPVESIVPHAQDFTFLLIFVIFCTIVLQLLQIQVLKRISAFTVNLSYNLEPLYSILIAMLFLGEAKELQAPFYAGVSLILLSIFLQMWSSIRQSKNGEGQGI